MAVCSRPMRITDVLDQHAQERPDALAVVDGTMRLSWATLRHAVDALAQRVMAEGLRVGDRVAVCGGGDKEWKG